MNTNNNDKTVFLASFKDWELWNLQFQAQAVAGGLWSEIQGVTLFLNKLTALNPARHKYKTLSQLTVIVKGSPESVAGDDDLGLLITITDLMADNLYIY